MATGTMRFPIRFDPWYRVLSTALLIPPAASYVEIQGEDVLVRMSWAFSASFPRSAVTSAAVIDKWVLSRGVHGFGGRWLVNGSGKGIVAIDLESRQRGHVMGFPIRLRQLYVSVEEPERLIAALKLDLKDE